MDRHFRKVNVMAVTTTGIFTGIVHCQSQQRLLDALNKGFYTQINHPNTDFIPICDAKMAVKGDSAVLMDMAYVRKSDVLFIGEEKNQGMLCGAPMHYPIRKKKAIKVVVNLPNISLTGNIYSEMWEELQDALTRTSQFIPMTNVDLCPPLSHGIEWLYFVAVNKDRISYIGKLQP